MNFVLKNDDEHKPLHIPCITQYTAIVSNVVAKAVVICTAPLIVAAMPYCSMRSTNRGALATKPNTIREIPTETPVIVGSTATRLG